MRRAGAADLAGLRGGHLGRARRGRQPGPARRARSRPSSATPAASGRWPSRAAGRSATSTASPPPARRPAPPHQNIPDYLWLVAQGSPSAAHGRHPPHQPAAGRHRQRSASTPAPSAASGTSTTRRSPSARSSGSPSSTARSPAERAGAPERRQGGHRRRRPGRPGGRLLPGAAWASSRSLYEAKQKLGGMVTGVIPGYRLSRPRPSTATWSGCGSSACRFELGRAIGKDVTLDGAPARPRLRLPGHRRPARQAAGHPRREGRRGASTRSTFLDRVQAGTDDRHRPAGAGHRRRQHRHGRRPHLPAGGAAGRRR